MCELIVGSWNWCILIRVIICRCDYVPANWCWIRRHLLPLSCHKHRFRVQSSWRYFQLEKPSLEVEPATLVLVYNFQLLSTFQQSAFQSPKTELLFPIHFTVIQTRNTFLIWSWTLTSDLNLYECDLVRSKWTIVPNTYVELYYISHEA